MSMASSQIFSDFSSMAASLLKQIICSLEITSTEANNLLRLWSCSSPTKWSSKRTSSYSEAITNVDKSIEFMDSMTNAKDDTVSVFGKSSKTYLTACQLQPWLTTKFSACMEAFLPSSSLSLNYSKLQGQQRYQKMAYYVIFYGLTQRKLRVAGVKMIEVSAIHLEKLSSNNSWRRMTLTLFVEPTRLSRMATNSSAVGS